MNLPEIQPATDERTTLTEFLDYFRAVLYRKSEGLTDEQAHTALQPSTLTIGALLRHMTFVEDYWFTHVILGLPQNEPWESVPWDDSPDWDFETAEDMPLAQLQEDYLRAIDLSRTVLAGQSDLDADVMRGGIQHSLRWVLVHMVEEYARHCGHADLIREYLDGAVGD